MFTYDIKEVTKKDSLDLTDDDRQKILKAVKGAKSDKVIITHGTDTMVKTAAVLEKLGGKTVVLTGAMLPEKFTDSDAKFNIGMAVSAVQHLRAGIYIALYGRVVPWKDFKKLHAEYEKKSKQGRGK
jgi:L-asparaginase